jgi:ABC-type transport system involved in multi-copper enzyme maturation permease subunit
MTEITQYRIDEPPVRPHLLRMLRSEYRKVTSTKTWWLFGIGVLATTGIALLINVRNALDAINNVGFGAANEDGTPATVGSALAVHAPDVYTSGQYFGGLFVMLLAILLITNEYYHQTATSTFLASPRRTGVVASKFLMAMIAAFAVWVVTSAIDIVIGSAYLRDAAGDSGLGAWSAQRSIVINLLMFALWGVFGVGIGALLRSQIGATVTATLLYTVGVYGAVVVVALIRELIYKSDGAWQLLVLYPGFAAQIAETPANTILPSGQHVQWWIGVIVMLAYGLGMATIGTLILRKRDVS